MASTNSPSVPGEGVTPEMISTEVLLLDLAEMVQQYAPFIAILSIYLHVALVR